MNSGVSTKVGPKIDQLKKSLLNHGKNYRNRVQTITLTQVQIEVLMAHSSGAIKIFFRRYCFIDSRIRNLQAKLSGIPFFVIVLCKCRLRSILRFISFNILIFTVKIVRKYVSKYIKMSKTVSQVPIFQFGMSMMSISPFFHGPE